MNYKYKKYPRFFEVDEVLVRLDSDGDDLVCTTWAGYPYGIGKALSEGAEITEEEYNRLLARRLAVN